MPTTSFPDPGAGRDFAYALQLALGGIFLVSALAKARRPEAFQRIVVAYEILPRWAAVIAPSVLAVETFLAVTFLTGWLIEVALLVAALTIILFAAATALNLHRGREIECGCFGSSAEQISDRSLMRLALMGCSVAVLVASLAAGGRPTITVSWLVVHGPESLTYVAACSALALFVTVGAVWALHVPELRGALGAAKTSRRSGR